MTFGTADYCVLCCTLVISALIGIYCRFSGGKQKTNKEYLLANQRQNPIFVGVSLMASCMSAISMLGGTSEAYVYGTHFFTLNVGYVVGIVLSTLLFVPIFYNLKSASMFKYLEIRFGYVARICASLASTIQMLLTMCVTLVAPAIALQTITDFSHGFAVILIGVICTFYSTVGGIKAAIYTDFFQAVLMFMAMFCTLYQGYKTVGSFSGIWDIANEHGRIDFLNFKLDLTMRHTWLSTLLGGIFTGIISNGINQSQIQRYLTMKNNRKAVISSIFYGPLLIALSLSICLTGLTIFSYYYTCDPITTGRIQKADQLLPFYVVRTFTTPGLSGLFVAGIFSASLSTISPLLNSLSAVTLEDYLKPLTRIWETIKFDTTSSFYSQIFVLFYGLVSIGISLLLLNDMDSILQTGITVTNVIGGPMLGLFCLGIFTYVANQKGSVIGFVIGIITVTWISVGKPRPARIPLPMRTDGCESNFNFQWNRTIVSNNIKSTSESYPYLYRISYLYYGFIGFFVTFILGYVFSIILLTSEAEKKRIDENLLSKYAIKVSRKKPPLSFGMTVPNGIPESNE